jgi:cutinase
MHNAVSRLSSEVKAKVIGGVLFGDTRNKQDSGQIRGYPKDQVKIFCDPNDGVCNGTLKVTAGHIVYLTNNDAEKAIKFLQSRIDIVLGSGRSNRRSLDSKPYGYPR